MSAQQEQVLEYSWKRQVSVCRERRQRLLRYPDPIGRSVLAASLIRPLRER